MDCISIKGAKLQKTYHIRKFALHFDWIVDSTTPIIILQNDY